ncbi:MAG: type III-A CRISPR-associated RAMP protein Csm3 [Candidatus Odinarchaeota archaeon]|nr:type III-A CRISPR-associated RAMP protein Csm3 [Candidatus Odinarchaeota archaeon]
MSGKNSVNSICLKGKILIRGIIEAKTGLHIGSSQQALEIGGLDNPVVRDPITRQPYIPGSSLKGKMRSLLELALNKPLKEVKEQPPKIRIHICDDLNCEVCRIFGRPAEVGSQESANYLTRLSVRDAYLTEDSVSILKGLETGYYMTEIKWENQIDRLTSAANPRQTERVPAGAEFAFEMAYDIYDITDLEYFKYLIEAMRLLEDSYIGGQGTRGYGKIIIKDIHVKAKNGKVYSGESEVVKEFNVKNVDELSKVFLERKEELRKYFFGE